MKTPNEYKVERLEKTASEICEAQAKYDSYRGTSLEGDWCWGSSWLRCLKGLFVLLKNDYGIEATTTQEAITRICAEVKKLKPPEPKPEPKLNADQIRRRKVHRVEVKEKDKQEEVFAQMNLSLGLSDRLFQKIIEIENSPLTREQRVVKLKIIEQAIAMLTNEEAPDEKAKVI